MVLSLNHRTQGHVWSMAEIKFTADAVKILQSILTRRIQKNSLPVPTQHWRRFWTTWLCHLW